MSEPGITRVGVISDTHDYLDPKVREIFEGVDYILHAGDIGMPVVIMELEDIAPVTAVRGNTDDPGINFQETALIQVGARRFLVHHIVEPRQLTDKLRRKIIRENPDVVVFGHTHKPFCESVGNTLFLNPGYAGKQRFELPRTIAILTCDAEGMTADFFDL
jgi:putative phosphoesterase